MLHNLRAGLRGRYPADRRRPVTGHRSPDRPPHRPASTRPASIQSEAALFQYPAYTLNRTYSARHGAGGLDTQVRARCTLDTGQPRD
ncbi:Uncharacterised protein [Nocardia brasiliensis]|nr:Uncharacterised protein [Nocardia brasiliensis]